MDDSSSDEDTSVGRNGRLQWNQENSDSDGEWSSLFWEVPESKCTTGGTVRGIDTAGQSKMQDWSSSLISSDLVIMSRSQKEGSGPCKAVACTDDDGSGQRHIDSVNLASPSKRQKLEITQRKDNDHLRDSNNFSTIRQIMSGRKERSLIELCGEESQFVDCHLKPLNEQDLALDGDTDDFYGLGPVVKKAVFSTFNITQMHSWQHDMLQRQVEQENKNALVLAPTGSGKTVIAIILLLRTVLVHQQDGIISLPYISLVAEKCKELRTLACRLSAASSTSFHVQEYAGAKGRLPVPVRKDDVRSIFICTIEKASLIWRQFARDISDDQAVYRAGYVVLDEFHMIGDGDRGAVLEQFLTSVLFWAGASTRVLGISATIGNPGRLAELLGGGNLGNCSLYHVSRRPTAQIKEHVVVLGGTFPIKRDVATGLGTIDFQDSSTHGDGFDITSSYDALQETIVQREDPAKLWLKIQQYRLHLQNTCLYKLPHRTGSVGLHFPPVVHIPDYVTKYCQDLLHSKHRDELFESGLSEEMIMTIIHAKEHAIAHVKPESGDHKAEEKSAAATFWKDRCAKQISNIVDPYARHRSTSEMQTDLHDWDSRIIANLVMEVTQRNGSSLVFCGTRSDCVTVCDYLTRAYRAVVSEVTASRETSDIISKERQNIIDHLREESSGLVHDVLIRGIRYGITYHTAALSSLERRVVEEAFSKKIILTLVCTTTLAAGITLPADRIIIRSPFIAGKFTTCTRYLQMVGRAGRTSSTTLTPDSYVFVPPKHIAEFQKLVDLHVEPVHSSLTSSDTYYTRNQVTLRGHSSIHHSGVTRVIITLIESSKIMPLSQLLEAYRLTLHYQQGYDSDQNGEGNEDICTKGNPTRTVLDLLKELKVLIEKGFIQIQLLGVHGKQTTLQDLERTGPSNQPSELRDRRPWGSTIDDEVLGRLRSADEAECKELIALLENAAVEDKPQDHVDLPDVHLCATPFTSAAVAGALSLEDAETFVAEASQMEKKFTLLDTLGILFLTISRDLARPLPDEIKMLLNREILTNFNGHCNSTFLETVGMGEAQLDLWMRGNTKYNKCEIFLSKLKRMWSALFAKELSMQPEKFDLLCQKFGFTRGDAMELIVSITSRFANIKNFCSSSGTFWWYAPLASATTVMISDSCDEELRGIIHIRHMTKFRARALYKLGCRTPKDVAGMTIDAITENVRFLGRWRAVEMIIDARMNVAEELIQNLAESQLKVEALN